MTGGRPRLTSNWLSVTPHGAALPSMGMEDTRCPCTVAHDEQAVAVTEHRKAARLPRTARSGGASLVPPSRRSGAIRVCLSGCVVVHELRFDDLARSWNTD